MVANERMARLKNGWGRMEKITGWEAPRSGWFKINTDGMRNSVARKVAVGGLIRDSYGRWLHGFSHNIGCYSITRAEMGGVMMGLEMAWEVRL